MAYGDRTVVETDTFDASIDGDWNNGPGGFANCAWVTGGYVQGTSGDSAMGSSGPTYDADQYATVTIQAISDYVGAMVRVASAATSGYAHYAYASSEYQLYNVNSGTWNLIDSTTGFAGVGDTVTCEAEGTTIRGGSNEGAGDTERLTGTDTTHTNGDPGVIFYGTAASNRITAFEAGDMGAAPPAASVNLLTLLGVG